MNPPEPGAPPKQRPSGCLLVALCIISAGMLIFGGCSVVLLAELRASRLDWMQLGIPAGIIIVLGVTVAVHAWRLHKRRRATIAAEPPRQS